MLGFVRMSQYAQDRSFKLVLSGLSTALAAQLDRERIGGDSSAHVRIFSDLDHALEWCEDQVLEEDRAGGEAARDPLADQLRRIAKGSAVDVNDFLAYVEPFTAPPGECIIRQKDQSNDLYFIETGKVSVRLETGEGRAVRLRTMGPGTIVGEVAFYLDVPRSASVVADLPTAGYRLTRANLERLRAERPDLAAMFHEFIAHRLAERVAETGRLVDTLIG
jgi:SulP family sulfate permease